MAEEIVFARDVAVDDEIYFPNSHRAQKVAAVTRGEGNDYIVFGTDDARWMVPEDHEIRKQVPDAAD